MLEYERWLQKAENEEIKNSKTVAIKSLKTDSSTTDAHDETNENEFAWATFFLVLSSVLLVVALVIALLSVLIKRKAKKNDTDSASNGGIESTQPQDNGGIE